MRAITECNSDAHSDGINGADEDQGDDDNEVEDGGVDGAYQGGNVAMAAAVMAISNLLSGMQKRSAGGYQTPQTRTCIWTLPGWMAPGWHPAMFLRKKVFAGGDECGGGDHGDAGYLIAVAVVMVVAVVGGWVGGRAGGRAGRLPPATVATDQLKATTTSLHELALKHAPLAEEMLAIIQTSC